MKKILVCAPHTDDMEFGCGGTIKMLSETDAEISLLVFSTCEQSLPKTFSVQDIKQEWHGMSVHSVSQSLNARSGVSLLFKRGLAFKPINQGNDGEGRIVWAEIEISTKKLLIIGVYAPSEKDDPVFFEKLFGMLEGRNYDHLVISGDFNVGLDENLDYMGYSTKAPRPKSRSTIGKHMKQFGICDIFRDSLAIFVRLF